MEKKGIEAPPAVYRPLVDEDDNSQIKDAVLQFMLDVTSTLPKNILPEFAFAGKSNVGKSSFLNTLVNRKTLTRTSAQPGKTQTINFYRVNGAVYFVDLPGYNYASADEAVKANWGKMVERHLHEDKQLRAIFLFLDLRHASSENDVLVYSWIIDQDLLAVLAGTKTDKLKRSQLEKQKRLLHETLGAPKETSLTPFSSITEQGEEELLRLVAEMARQASVRLQQFFEQ